MAYQYNPATGTGEASIRLTNTSDPQSGGYLTGFVLNVLGEATATLEANPTGSFYAVHNPEIASPYGRFDAGAALGNGDRENKHGGHSGVRQEREKTQAGCSLRGSLIHCQGGT